MEINLTDNQFLGALLFGTILLVSGDSSDHGCGKGCKEYEPRNKKSGCCRFRKNLYGATDETITVKLK